MAVRIDPDRCRGCGACVAVCPGDLLAVSEDRVHLREADECWLCLSCVKACPNRALSGRLPFTLGDPGAGLWVETDGEGLRWICRSRAGIEEFVLR